MLRDETNTRGPRPPNLHNPSVDENRHPLDNEGRARISASQERTLTASSRNNADLLTLAGQADSELLDTSSTSFDFLPAVTFDDFHTDITNAAHDYQLSQFPLPGGTMRTKEDNPVAEGKRALTSKAEQGTKRPIPAAARPARMGSVQRGQSGQSGGTRQGSSSSTISLTASAPSDSSAAGTRARRQSHYPPLSGAGAIRGARKSVAPGTPEMAAATKVFPRRRPSLQGNNHPSAESTPPSRTHLEVMGSAAEGARLASARAAKAKSLQPAGKQGHLFAPAVTPDHNRSTSLAVQSPGQSAGRGVTTPSSSARRLSVMPGLPPSSSHASGLGARTVSPTDARRAKRMSMMPGVPPMPATPSDLQVEHTSSSRAASRSPSTMPRKAPTPTSQRTTPDPNRKSYSSGLSIGSAQSFTTARTSTGSLQPRMPQSASTSRLPTPKSQVLHTQNGGTEDEVPPVPAIPKAYESPKESPMEATYPFRHRKSSLPYDSVSVNSISTNEPVFPTSTSDNMVTGGTIASETLDVGAENGKGGQQSKKKQLQPLRLPPFNLLPLSTPTADKIAALTPEPPSSMASLTPPPRRANAKTPSTPMTASKTSFFSSRNRNAEVSENEKDAGRSKSSFHHVRGELATMHDLGVSTQPIALPTRSKSTRQPVSPFQSSSVPKVSADWTIVPRSHTSGDLVSTESSSDRSSRLNGPRELRTNKLVKTETLPDQTCLEEPTTPSTGTSLRRKLSLGWKRTTSKSTTVSQSAHDRMAEQRVAASKHDNMPPPRLPASATMNNLSSISLATGLDASRNPAASLDPKMRKISSSSLNLSGHERTRSDNWVTIESPRKEQPSSTIADGLRLTSRASSNLLNQSTMTMTSRPSSSSMRVKDPWTVDLDREDMLAEDEVRKLNSKRKETEQAARQLDALRARATPKERVSPQQAVQSARLNLYERGEIVDYQDIYFCGTQSAAKHNGNLQTDAANFGYDDERGDYGIVTGDHISFRYEIVDILGKGSFGQVVRCIDHKTGGLVAIKIIRNKKRFHQQALVEVNILQKLRDWDPQNKHSMVNFTQSFYFRSHLCISTELLDMNLYEFIKFNGFRGFSLKLIRRFTKQLLSSLLLLKQHRVIHCDLKPENILLAHPMHSEIKVIDFGSSCFENEKVYTYIQSRFYRSPEVILGMTYGMPIDMWSIGCILAELFTGYPIFPGENEQEQLACIMEVFGPPEKHLIEKSTRKKLFFDSLGKPRLTVSSKGRRRKPSSKTLQQVLKCEDEAFIDFLSRCLRWDPDRRLRPDDAIRHEFLTGQKSSVPLTRSMTTRTDSPIKRSEPFTAATTTTTTASTGPRPLPEPPSVALKNGTTTRQRELNGNASSGSPVKIPAAIPRKQPGTTAAANHLTSAATAAKRMSIGPGVPLLAAANSGLPRVTSRGTSGKQDYASAGATAAMGRKG